MKIKRASTDFSEDLSNTQIGYAIISGVILCLLFYQLKIGEDQNGISKYRSFLQSHYNFKYMCKLYKDMLEITTKIYGHLLYGF
jgi:hypothetical protein